MPLIEEFVPTDANRELFNRVMRVTQEPDPVRMFIYGPQGSGKTTLAQMRGRERDLLSNKEVMFCHVDELASFLSIGEVGEQFLERVGLVDILLLDGFERCLEGDRVRLRLIELLLNERLKKDLSTVIFSSLNLDRVPDGELADLLRDYEQWNLTPLDEAGCLQLTHVVYEALRNSAQQGQRANSLTEGALDYIATSYSSDLSKLKSTLRFLVTQADFDNEAPVEAFLVSLALGDSKVA